MIIVVSGPGGVGKGTVVRELVAGDARLLLSRSWTTRAPRPGEDPDAYVFVDRATFAAREAAGGFLEHAEFLGDRYGTPTPDPDDARDLLLEIDVQGAAQVVERFDDVLLILLVAPSLEAQRQRLEARGDPPEHVARRLERGQGEVVAGRALGAIEVVNDDLAETVGQLARIIDAARAQRAS